MKTKMTTLGIIVSLLLFTRTYADSLNFNDCGSQFSLEGVEIEGCAEVPCSFLLGEEITVKIKYIPKVAAGDLKQKVEVVVLGIPEPVEVTPADLCSYVECASESEEEHIFEGSVLLHIELPPVLGTLRWRMTNEAGTDMICMETFLDLLEPEYLKNKRNQTTTTTIEEETTKTNN